MTKEVGFDSHLVKTFIISSFTNLWKLSNTYKKNCKQGHFQKSLFLILMSWFTSFCKNLQQMLSIEVMCHMCSCRMIRSLTSHSRFQFIIFFLNNVMFFTLQSYKSFLKRLAAIKKLFSKDLARFFPTLWSNLCRSKKLSM